MATIFAFAITGNAYWLIVRNSYGLPVELWFVPPWMIEPKWPEDGSVFISHYEYNCGDGLGPMQIDFEDVVHFRHGMNPRNTRLGLRRSMVRSAKSSSTWKAATLSPASCATWARLASSSAPRAARWHRLMMSRRPRHGSSSSSAATIAVARWSWVRPPKCSPMASTRSR
jgi:hypothetical protein